MESNPKRGPLWLAWNYMAQTKHIKFITANWSLAPGGCRATERTESPAAVRTLEICHWRYKCRWGWIFQRFKNGGHYPIKIDWLNGLEDDIMCWRRDPQKAFVSLSNCSGKASLKFHAGPCSSVLGALHLGEFEAHLWASINKNTSHHQSALKRGQWKVTIQCIDHLLCARCLARYRAGTCLKVLWDLDQASEKS